MYFNSFHFFVFFILVLSGYFLLRHKWQNYWLLAASYFFYAAWDVRFVGLLFLTTVIDYSASQAITNSSTERGKIVFLRVSIFCNLCLLAFFKYFNFFTESFIRLMDIFGFHLSPVTLQIILPVGISFYTFQSMSYTIDVFRGEVKATRRFFDYALYVAFFPQLVAGPIERARHLLPQILRPRDVSFLNIQAGAYFVFFGIFLKVFLADNLARIVDPVFSEQGSQTGFAYLLAGYGFTWQIYGDFAGYSYIAKGLGQMLGFEIMDNFNLPYFAKNPQEFWHRWHISLSVWLRDYLYIPLGGNRYGRLRTLRNLFVTMLLGGLWHGAKITFVLWGFFHGILLATHHLLKPLGGGIVSRGNVWKKIVNLLKLTMFFHIIVLSWFLFRARSIEQVNSIFWALFTHFHFNIAAHQLFIKKLVFYITPVIIMQLLQNQYKSQIAVFNLPVLLRTIIYVLLFYLIVIFGVNNAQDFIYFQF